ncbi:MAG: thiol reductant ABC exporter subunit CydD [Proteobacteria bacterium]|nr:thiol reductant ABC exporter subunit CydD [Pseudomonadota bacterium]
MESLAIAAVETPRSAGARARVNSAANGISAALQIAAPLLWLPQAALIAYAIGNVADGSASFSIVWPAFGVLAIGVLKAILDSIGFRLAFRTARQAVTELRAHAVAALAARSPLDANRTQSGQAASVIGEQAEMVVPYVARFQIAKLRAVIVPLAILLAVSWLSWAAALVLFIAAPLIPIFMALIGWRAKAASEAQLAETGSMNAFLLDRLRGIATIRALDAVDETARQLRANAESLRMRTMAVLRIAFLSSAVLELFSALGVAMVAVYVGFHLLGQLNFGAWNGSLSLSEGLFILLLSPAFFEPLRELSAVWHDRAAGQAAIEELSTLATTGRHLLGGAENSNVSTCFSRAPAVVVEKLCFRYAESESLILDRFDLAISPGEHIALLGPSGSGKSTLLSLLIGLGAPISGSISIGGHSVSAETADDLRNSIAWIGQRPHIFAGTLASNVALGRNIGRGDIAQALRFAKLDEIARTRGPDAIGENGIGLSGGEILRLAIARVAAKPNARLILADEPTAHLDAETAGGIVDNLLTLARDKTLIVATHDLTLARRMDRIVQLEDWRLEKAA